MPAARIVAWPSSHLISVLPVNDYKARRHHYRRGSTWLDG